MKKHRALIIYGGWSRHEPEQVANLFADALSTRGAEVELSDTLDSLNDAERINQLDLIFPCWTVGTLSDEQNKNLLEAVRSGVGLGGVHGGMGDAFRGFTHYEWMVGGHFVGHPHVGDYEIRKTATKHPATENLPAKFNYNSEQYYMLVDPANEVLAETTYLHEGRTCTMPVMWTKTWGKGRVFYSALGHVCQEFLDYPNVTEATTRGLLWAARKI